MDQDKQPAQPAQQQAQDNLNPDSLSPDQAPEDHRQEQLDRLREALAQGNRVRHLLRDQALLELLQGEVNRYSDLILRLSPAQVNEFTELSASRSSILRFFNTLKGVVAAGEAAAKRLQEEEQSTAPHPGGLL
jgi:hypothetical protein